MNTHSVASVLPSAAITESTVVVILAVRLSSLRGAVIYGVAKVEVETLDPDAFSILRSCLPAAAIIGSEHASLAISLIECIIARFDVARTLSKVDIVGRVVNTYVAGGVGIDSGAIVAAGRAVLCGAGGGVFIGAAGDPAAANFLATICGVQAFRFGGLIIAIVKVPGIYLKIVVLFEVFTVSDGHHSNGGSESKCNRELHKL